MRAFDDVKSGMRIQAANSIRHSIVEGSSGTNAQFANYLRHAIASADDVED
jgi:hypothetical protein